MSVLDMAWRRIGIVVTMAALVAVALAPGAAAGHASGEHGATSTGDVDTYGVWPYTGDVVCTLDLHPWEVRLTLVNPTPGDRVLVSAQEPILPRAAGAAVATYDEPTVTFVVDGGGCIPFTEVVGLTVSGDLAYEVAWTVPSE